MGRYKNPDYIRDWKRANKDKMAAHRKKDYASIFGRARNLYHTSKRRAQKKGLEFTLTRQWIEDKISGGCELTGLTFSLESKHPYTPSVDREDSTKGYTPENCRVILWALNAAFNSWGQEKFNEIVRTYKP